MDKDVKGWEMGASVVGPDGRGGRFPLSFPRWVTGNR